MKIKQAAGRPLMITDVTLRDGQQSIMNTRMLMQDICKVAADLDAAGFYSLEVWGGATFDVALRFLNEDPWERPRMLKRLAPNTPLQMLLRGQNLVGYAHYPDDVVSAFIHRSAEVGIDIFRMFDALNDERNLQASLKAVKGCGKHAQLGIAYSLTGLKMGGPIYNLGYYVDKALVMQSMGADSVCLKDMAGMLAPDDAFTLVKALKEVLKVPLHLHSHCASGMAPTTYYKAIEAGIDGLDMAIGPLALRSSVPALEPFITSLCATDMEIDVDLGAISNLGRKLEDICAQYMEHIDKRLSLVDTEIIRHQIPGGMISSLLAQLREISALDRLPEIYKEIKNVRAELGYPPLVTPTSQFIVTQAVQNVLLGRYKLMLSQVRDYCYGLYGRPPAPIDPHVQELAMMRDRLGKEPITCRPADGIPPFLDEAKDALKEISHDPCDILTYALFPATAMKLLKSKSNR
ncbi:pyruvate carboxylase subunit B [Chloroflexota bacterium]